MVTATQKRIQSGDYLLARFPSVTGDHVPCLWRIISMDKHGNPTKIRSYFGKTYSVEDNEFPFEDSYSISSGMYVDMNYRPVSNESRIPIDEGQLSSGNLPDWVDNAGKDFVMGQYKKLKTQEVVRQ